jgi:hypothetical protein
MPSLISSTENTLITGIFSDIFDTRAKSIVIYKEPIKTTTSFNPSNLVYGFGESQQDDAFTYTQVTGVYPAVVIVGNIKHPKNIEDNSELWSRLSQGEYSIKVKKDCRDYINNGKTEKITFDDKTCYLDGEEAKINDQYYMFALITTK